MVEVSLIGKNSRYITIPDGAQWPCGNYPAAVLSPIKPNTNPVFAPITPGTQINPMPTEEAPVLL